MSAPFSQTDIDTTLARPHVAPAQFAVLDLPSGLVRLHSGVGTVNVGGYDWKGVSDPVGGRIVSVSEVREPRLGEAAKVTITLTGADKAFLQSIHATAAQIEGRSAELYWALFDGENGQVVRGLVEQVKPGYMSAPRVVAEGIGRRTVQITIESIWSAKNFRPGYRWTPAGHRALYPGDKGLDYVGVKVTETVK